MEASIGTLQLEFFDKLILAAVFTQMILTIGLLVRMGILRVNAIKERTVRMSEIALNGEKYPDAAKKAGNALNNQFQIPVMFYVLVVILLIVSPANLLQVVLAWGFVLSRIAHAFIHIGSNNVTARFNVYLLGVIILTAFIFSVFWPIYF